MAYAAGALGLALNVIVAALCVALGLHKPMRGSKRGGFATCKMCGERIMSYGDHCGWHSVSGPWTALKSRTAGCGRWLPTSTIACRRQIA